MGRGVGKSFCRFRHGRIGGVSFSRRSASDTGFSRIGAFQCLGDAAEPFLAFDKRGEGHDDDAIGWCGHVSLSCVAK